MAHPSISQRLHEQLSQIIAIAQPGARLPSEPELAETLGVSRATLREAMRTFETQGMIRRIQGSGTYVNRPPNVLESGLEVLESLETIAQRSNLKVSIGTLQIEQHRANQEECRALNLDPGEQVLQVSRVVMAEKRPAAYLIDTLPLHVLAPQDLPEDFSGSILDLLIRLGSPESFSSRTEISAVQADPLVARALQIQRGDVLLCFIADLFKDGLVIDHSYSYFLPGYFRFHVVRKVG